MITGRREGTVLIVLLTVSTIIMLTVMGVCYVIGSKHYMQYVKQPADVQTVEYDAQHDAGMHTFLA